MNYLLAQASPTPNSLMQFMLIVSMFANVGMAFATIFLAFSSRNSKRTILPDPLNIQKVKRIVEEKDCFARHAESTKSIEQLHQQLNKLENSRETQRVLASSEMGKIYKHIEEVRRELSEKIDNQPAALIAMLRNTKARFDE
jgi:hypothetical protein